MRIVNVTPGLLPIPPNGWGAVEKIIWEIHQNLLELGHESKILYTNEVEKDDWDVVHVHVANLALILAEKGIPYIFSFHDHHAYLYGKDSHVFKENLEAIEKSLVTLVPANFLVDYFDRPNVIYFSHGVNPNIFIKNVIDTEPPVAHKLLCVANNGWAGDPSADRKGFSYAIEAAKNLDLPITIAGPENNKKYFEANPSDYSKLNILYNLTEKELVECYRNHTIFLHPSILEAGHPNLTLLEAMSCGLPIVGTYEDNNNLPGLFKVERNTKQISDGILSIIKNYEQFRNTALETAENLSWKNRIIDLVKVYKKYTDRNMREILIEAYENTVIRPVDAKRPKNELRYNFVGEPFVEVKGSINNKYIVEFIDMKNDKVIHKSEISNNMWVKCGRKYYTDWKITVKPLDPSLEEDYEVIRFNPEGHRVYISLDSKSLGDTLAWFPMVEEFRKKWNCKVICSTFRNEFFKDTYPEIEFVNPGTNVEGLYAMFNIGWYYFENGEIDYAKTPSNFRMLPLQKTASDVLGLEYKEVLPILDKSKVKRQIEGKYVCIAPHASALAKYWNRPGGWQKIVDYLNEKGYKVVYISQEPLGDAWHDSKLGGTLKNVIDKSGDLPIDDRFSDLCHADYFIGVGSGLSWLAWSSGVRTMMISGFSRPFTEFTTNCDRIFNSDPEICNGCFNTHKLDPGDWQWCPVHKGTDRHFECTKTITESQIIEVLEQRL
jgi:autotransporter strand-loop-strand O-heptosyltransferase